MIGETIYENTILLTLAIMVLAAAEWLPGGESSPAGPRACDRTVVLLGGAAAAAFRTVRRRR